MTVVRLQRHAPEAQNATTCAVCGTADSARVTDHLQVGTPGAPQQDAGVCESCGGVLDRVADKYGPQVTMLVGEAQQQASDREITVPRKPSADPSNHPTDTAKPTSGGSADPAPDTRTPSPDAP
jgi:hypothetical protein